MSMYVVARYPKNISVFTFLPSYETSYERTHTHTHTQSTLLQAAFQALYKNLIYHFPVHVISMTTIVTVASEEDRHPVWYEGAPDGAGQECDHVPDVRDGIYHHLPPAPLPSMWQGERSLRGGACNGKNIWEEGDMVILVQVQCSS